MKFDFTAYMKDLAKKLNLIGHIDDDESNKRFYMASSTASLEEILQNIPIITGLNLVVEDNLEGSILENQSGATFDRQLCSFFLMKKASVNDMASRNNIIYELDAAITSIISRIRRDYYSDNAGTTDIGLRNIEWNSLTYFTFGPVLDNMYGLHCSFTLLYHVIFEFNADDWNENAVS